MIGNALIIGAVLILLLLYVILQSTIFAKPTGSYEAIIVNKKEQDTVLYTGIFIPMKIYILETTELHQLNVKKQVYDRINVGDRVTVTRYSNGRHRLQG